MKHNWQQSYTDLLASVPPERFTKVGGLTTVTAGATHWIDHVSTIVSIVLALAGLAGMVYGIMRQHQQKLAEERREQREIEAQRLLVEMHNAKMTRMKDTSHPSPDSDSAPL
jgi:hypothetical protein